MQKVLRNAFRKAVCNAFCNTLWVAWVAVFLTHARADDWHHFETLANQTIKAVKNGHPDDIEQLIRLQEHLMDIGIKACKNYAQANPQDAKMFHLVVNSAEDMKFLSLNEMKEQWHAKQFLLSHGIAVDKLLQNSTTGSLLDTVVHPATAYIALREYRRTRDASLLMQVHHELTEAVLQLTYLHQPDNQSGAQ